MESNRQRFGKTRESALSWVGIIPYLAVRNFGVRIYSGVAGIIACAVAASAVTGALVLSLGCNSGRGSGPVMAADAIA